MTRARALGLAAALLPVLSGGVGPASAQTAAPQEVVVSLRTPAGVEAATARLTAVPGGTRVRVQARGLAPGFHGFHLHAVPQCEGATTVPFSSAGGHYARDGQPHGGHAGDLPPLLVAADGTARVDTVVDGFSLAELFDGTGGQGAALVVHAAPDNLAHIPERYRSGSFTPAEAGPDAVTLQTGDSGGRVACGVVGLPGAGGTTGDAPASAAGASARLRTASGAEAGTVTVRQLAGRVEVRGRVTGLTPGFHGFHVHAVGVCDGATPTPFSSAGGHLSAAGAPHGRHDGDLPALRVLADGTATVDLDSDRLDVDELFDADGAAFVVHAAPDNLAHVPERYRSGSFRGDETGPDELTRATGDSGGRVLCGVLQNQAATYRWTAQRRLLDTRTAGTPLASGRTLEVGVVPRPSAAVMAMLTLTAIRPTADTVVTIGPAGTPRPVGSSAPARRGQVVATTVLVPLSATGSVILANGAGRTHVAVDLVGLYTAEAPVGAGRYMPVTPSRLGLQQVRAGTERRVVLAGTSGVPARGVSGVLVTLTAARPTAAGHLTVAPAGVGTPRTSVLNWQAGQNRAVTLVAPLGVDGAVALRTASGSVDVIVDVLGWYTATGTAGGRHVPLPPYQVRGVDDIRGVSGGLRLGPGESRDVVLAGVGGIPTRGARAVVLAVTATATTGRSHLVVHPTGTPRPATSNLNWSPGDALTTTVVTPLGAGGAVRLFNNAGSASLGVVVLGYVDAG